MPVPHHWFVAKTVSMSHANKALQGQDFATGPRAASLQSGVLEGSNVNPVEAMVKMMDFSRSFEAQIKMITEAKSIDETGSSMMRLP